jgi:L-seryl-tRNA(Ser) seleniumtransferase
MHEELLRRIKSVDYLLSLPAIGPLCTETSREFVHECLGNVLRQLRQRIVKGELNREVDLEQVIIEELRLHCQQRLQANLRPVINATGTLLHTNLGRAPLAAEVLNSIVCVAAGYSNLEYELLRGSRGSRDQHCEELLQQLLGCEAAVIVNNNAAAVMLVLDELAAGGEVIISRGEMIEIGGAFRIPDVMAKSGAILREVGTTNRTRLSDYEAAINEKTRLILRVHPSNYRIIGFTEKPTLKELVALSTRHQLPLFEDMGSGCLVDLAPYGIKDEPTVQASIAAGVSVLTFSGDKMLGGPQAGIIAGKTAYLKLIRRNPLMRALRVDKLCYSALSTTLQLYRNGRAWQSIPLLRALAMDVKELTKRSRGLLQRVRRHLPAGHSLTLAIKQGYSLMGGGAAPEHPLPTMLITISAKNKSAAVMETILRRHNPPVVARIEDDLLVLDLRTVLAHNEAPLVDAIVSLAT